MALSRRDARALIPAIQGRIPLVIMADRAADMMNIVDLKTDYPDLNLIIVGATEGWMIADQLAAADIKVMIDPQENLPGSFERVNARSDSANLLKDAGVDFAIMNRSDSLTHQARLLPQHAGNAVGNGLDWESAFAAITSVPARWFGLSTGTLSVGSDNFVIWNGDPLELTNAPTHMVINGDIQSLESRQTKLRDRYHPHHTDTRPHKYRN